MTNHDQYLDPSNLSQYFLLLRLMKFFIKYVAMKINLLEVLTVDVFSIGLIYLSLYIPARYIKKIHPIIALKFK